MRKRDGSVLLCEKVKIECQEEKERQERGRESGQGEEGGGGMRKIVGREGR